MSQPDSISQPGYLHMIGIIGSGLDSMIVTRSVREKIPGVDVLCFGDNLRIFPAAAFNPDEMMQNAVQNSAHLIGLGARLILIASHTLSCIAGAAIAAGCAGVPVLDIITPSVNRAVLKSRYQPHRHYRKPCGDRKPPLSGENPGTMSRSRHLRRILSAADSPYRRRMAEKTGNRHDRQKIPDSLEDPPDRHAHSGQHPLCASVDRDSAENRQTGPGD